MYRGRVEIYQAERRRQRSSTPRCYICEAVILYENPLAGSFMFRGRRHQICSKCRADYWEPVKQAAAFGKRYPFIEKGEMPRLENFGMSMVSGDASGIVKHHCFTQIYSILLLAKKRQISRQKEVNWMVDEVTRKVLKLPDQVAQIIAKTFAVRGDDATLTEDEALIRIRDLLEAIDEKIIDRNKGKRLS